MSHVDGETRRYAKPTRGGEYKPHQSSQLSLLTSASSASPSPVEALDEQELAEAQRDYPRIVDAVTQLDDLVRYHEARYEAKDAELTRCIHVGEELIGQLDLLKERCRVLAQERDSLRDTLAKNEALHQQPPLTSSSHRAEQGNDESVRQQETSTAAQRQREHEEALRRQELWWQDRLDELRQTHARALEEGRRREEALQQKQAHAAAEAQEAARRVAASHEKDLAALRRELASVQARTANDSAQQSRESAALSQQLATQQESLRRLLEDPEGHVPVTTTLLGLTSTAHVAHRQLQLQLERLVESVESEHAGEEDAVVGHTRTSRSEMRKAVAKASAVLARTVASPPSSSTANQGVHHSWLSDVFTHMLAMMECFATLWRLNAAREEHLRQLLTDKCARDQRHGQSSQAEMEEAIREAKARAEVLEADKAALQAAFDAQSARHVEEVAALTATHSAREDAQCAALREKHLHEKQRIMQVADAQMQSVLLEAQLEVERWQRANARLQGQLASLGSHPATATAITASAVATHAAGATVLTSPTLTGTLKSQAEEITRLEEARRDLQRRLREEEAAREALRDELKVALLKAGRAAATAAGDSRGSIGGGTLVVRGGGDSHRGASDKDDPEHAMWSRLEQENRELRAKLVRAVREAQDELDGLQAQNACLTQDLVRTRSELETLRHEVLPEMESAAKEWEQHRHRAQQAQRELEARLEVSESAVHTLEAQLAEKDAALASAQCVREELEALANDLKEALGRAALDVQQQHEREEALREEATQLAQALESTKTDSATTSEALEARLATQSTRLVQLQDELARTADALAAAEKTAGAQQHRLEELEAGAAESARLHEDTRAQRAVAAHTLEAAQARAAAAESALADVQVELERQRRLTARARDDVKQLAEAAKRDAEAQTTARQAWQAELDTARADAAAAVAAQKRLEEERSTLEAVCTQLRVRAEESKATAQSQLEEQLQHTTESHRATLRLHEAQQQALRERLDAAEQALDRLSQQLENREAALTDAHRQLEASQRTRDTLEARVAELERKLGTAQREEAVAREALTSARRECNDLTANSVAKSVHDTAVSALRDVKSHVVELEAQVQLAARHEKRVAMLESELAAARERLTTSDTQREALHEEVQALRQRILDAQAQHSEAMRGVQGRLREAEDALAELTDCRAQDDTHRAAALQEARDAQAVAEVRVTELERRLAAREAEAHVALDRVRQELGERVEQAQREAAALVEDSRHELAAVQAQCAARTREAEQLAVACAQYQQDLAQSQSELGRLQARLEAARAELSLLAASHAAERKELEGLRRVNRALEGRLTEAENDREPLRQRLKHLLDTTGPLAASSANTSALAERSVATGVVDDSRLMTSAGPRTGAALSRLSLAGDEVAEDGAT